MDLLLRHFEWNLHDAGIDDSLNLSVLLKFERNGR